MFEQFKSEFESLDLETLSTSELEGLDDKVMGYRPFYTNDDPEKWDAVCNMRVTIKAVIERKDPQFYQRREDARITAHLNRISDPDFMKRRREQAELIGEPAYDVL